MKALIKTIYVFLAVIGSLSVVCLIGTSLILGVSYLTGLDTGDSALILLGIMSITGFVSIYHQIKNESK